MTEITTKFGKIKAVGEGRVFWADNTVWDNWPKLLPDTLQVKTPDGYSIEIYLAR